jgi:hypothetical protein
MHASKHCGRAAPDSLGRRYPGREVDHFAAKAKPIPATVVSFFAVPFADQQTQASMNKTKNQTYEYP